MTKAQLKALEDITKGKWSVDGVRNYFESESGPLVVDQYGRWIAIACTDAFFVEGERKEISPEEQQANAQALAALPDLLAERAKMIEVMRAIVEWVNEPGPKNLEEDRAFLINTAYRLAKTVLAAAEGQE